MPELPEVETTLRGMKLHVQGKIVRDVIVRHPTLRWPIPQNLAQQLFRKKIISLQRRGKYILMNFSQGTLILHLGMSGRVRILIENTPPQKHDHVDIVFNQKLVLRFTDPRRFGALLWTSDNPMLHPLLKNLGVEPLESIFSARYLWQQLHTKKAPIKSVIMDSHVVTGVGNIYAAEALFRARVHPLLPACALTLSQCQDLVKAIKYILRQAIQQGGTTLRDFTNSEGKPGYFIQKLQVYGRDALPCLHCQTVLSTVKIAQRSTVFCEYCQNTENVDANFLNSH